MDTATRLSVLTEREAHAAPRGVLAGTQVLTLDGVLPVEFLQPGDRIVTRSGARRLLAVSVQRRKRVALVRIRAATLGHDRPENDLLLAPGQPVVIRDWRARALFGVAITSIPAARLADGEFVTTEQIAEARFFTLRFEDHEVIYAEGLEIACPAVEVAWPEALSVPTR